MTFNHKTIEELHDLLVKKEISAVELTQATLADIKAREAAVGQFHHYQRRRSFGTGCGSGCQGH